jgi:hypothetical protein
MKFAEWRTLMKTDWYTGFRIGWLSGFSASAATWILLEVFGGI